MTNLTEKNEDILDKEKLIVSIKEAVLKRKIAPYDKASFYQDLFLSACFEGKKEQAKIIIETFMVDDDDTDIGMMNYLILKVDNLEALKIYSSIVDMNAPSVVKEGETEDDWCHIHMAAMRGDIDMLNYCHEIGYADSENYIPFDFVSTMIMVNKFKEAELYAKQWPEKPGDKTFKRILNKIAKCHEGRSVKTPVERIKTLSAIYPDTDLLKLKPHKAVFHALGNGAVDVAQYLLDIGTRKEDVISPNGLKRLFNSKYGAGFNHEDSLDFLLELGAVFNKDQSEIILKRFPYKKLN